ncbi:predicted protein [Chaetomium globosum CBS 148.51]|uniref:Uncharacterized protein n=1 Tax=Chaetomium globosum (strain ATCC 6205 / CBS 148.51 / DSM 1962 / NBRC 6347 / NRRL 1970) TaxID=306901 RepID=Q2HFH0_CHAGB|nr:uncharacterized protein CHGG_01034 [Chaetomium globosum CBS 148.51]EAQ92799.1 predicted protein [Chaetomium globosum CBS 148.51]
MQNVFISPATTMAHKPMGADNTPDYEVSDGELSFGVELEFLFYYRDSRLDDWQDPEALVVDDEEERALPPALVLPDDVDYIEDTYDGWTPDDENEERRGAEGSQEGEGEGGHVGEPKKTPRSWAAGLIEHAILSVPGAKLERSRTPGRAITPQHALIDRFRLRVNLTTGLHCHVGAGIEPAEDFNSRHSEAPEGGAQTEEAQAEGGGVQPKSVAVRMARHPLGVFKRAAALMWAADGFMAQVFPPERSLSEYAPPISFCSRLAHGIQLRYYHDSQHNLQTHERPLPPRPP